MKCQLKVVLHNEHIACAWMSSVEMGCVLLWLPDITAYFFAEVCVSEMLVSMCIVYNMHI